MNWWWLKRVLGPSAYDQGHQDGFKEGYKEGQDWGHEHGACEHTHPFEEAKVALGAASEVKRAPGWGSGHGGQ